MPNHAIRDLMDYWRHCHECSALLVTVPGGAICTHCGFELDDPEDNYVLMLKKADGMLEKGEGFWMADDWLLDNFDEAA